MRDEPLVKWAENGIEAELDKLASLGEHNPNKPGSPYYTCLLKIASIIKGDGRHISPEEALNRITNTSLTAYPWMTAKKIEYQWKRAYKAAEARYRQSSGIISNPPPPQPSTNGHNIDIQNPRTKDYLLGFDQLGYTFKMNELDDSIYCNGDRMTDTLAALILNRMRDIGLNKTGWVERAYMQSAHENCFNPIREYLDSLEWDGKDYIRWFVQHYTTETTGLGKQALLRWMIGAVAKIYENAQNFMLVIDGPQGIGKSTFARWLCPLADFFIEGPIAPDDKDSFLRLCTKMVWEVAELQSTTRKADREALKHFITTQEVTLRKAYGKHDLIKPSIASLIGTINEDGAGFLTDPTGSRRFVIICFESFNWAYLTDVEVKNLWAQAVAHYKSGISWTLTNEEKQQQHVVNGRYEMDSMFAAFFHEYFYVDLTSDEFETVGSIMDCLELNGLKGHQQANLNELARLMRQLGCTKFRARVGSKRPIAYRGVKQHEPVNL